MDRAARGRASRLFIVLDNDGRSEVDEPDARLPIGANFDVPATRIVHRRWRTR